MNLLPDSPSIDRLGWTLLHSTWQFLLIASAAAVVLRAMAHRSSTARYAAALMALALVLIVPAATWINLPAESRAVSHENRPKSAPPQDILEPVRQALRVSPVAGANDAAVASPPQPVAIPHRPHRSSVQATAEKPSSWRFALRDRLAPWLPGIVAGWCLGVLAFAFRPILGWWTVRRLRSMGTSAIPSEIQLLVDRVASSLKLRRAVKVLQSSLVHVPMAIGYFKPVVLVPLGLITGLPTSQLEAILAHELAHVRRHDYLINVVQTLIETLFFYHPAVWWLSSRVRDERENCCDDLAVASLGSRSEYGRALLAIEELRGASPVLALGAKDGSLLLRVRRLVSRPATPRSSVGALATLCVLGAFLVSAGWLFSQRVKAEPRPAESEKLKSGLNVISGRVLNDEMHPVPSAEVGLQVWEPNRNKLPDDEFIATSFTDKDGHYELSIPANLDPAKTWGTVWAVADGFIPKRATFESDINDLTSRSWDLRMIRAKETTLEIHDAQAIPAAGVRVAVTSQRLPESIGWPTPRSWLSKLTVETDAEGRVRLPHVLPDALAGLSLSFPNQSSTIELDQNYYLNVRPATTSPEFRLQLPPTGRVRGQLTGERLANLSERRITLKTECWPASQSLPGAWGIATVAVDADGRFDVDGLAAGSLSILPFLPDDQPLRAEIPPRLKVTDSQTTDVEIKIQRGVRIVGQVRKSDTKEPCADVAYKLIYGASARDKSGMLDSFEVRTDKNGEFSAYVPPGPIELRMSRGFRGYMEDVWWGPHKGYLGARYEVPAGSESFDLEPIELVPEVPVNGRLVDADGKPLTDWTVYGYPDVPGKPRDEFRMNCVAGVSTDQTGKFEGRYPQTVPPAFWNVSHRDWPSPYEFDDKKWDAKVLTESPLVLQVDFRPPANVENKQPEAEPKPEESTSATKTSDASQDVVFDCDITNEKTREPIRNAKISWRIEAFNKDEARRSTLFEGSFLSGDTGRYQVRIPKSVIYEMDANGIRTVTGVDDAGVAKVRGLVWIEAAHPDYLTISGSGHPFYMPGEDAGIQPDHRHLKLEPGVEVTGRFLKPDGTPAADMVLMVARNREGFGDSTGNGFYTRTNAEGRFRLVTQYGWPQRLHWFPQNYENNSRALTKTFGDQGTIRLKTGPRLKGRIESRDGKPLSGIVVQATTGTRVPILYATSDANGQFSFAPSPEGEYHLLPTKRFVDFSGKEQTAPVPPPFDAVKYTLSATSEPVILRAPETVTIRIKVVDAEGMPLSGRRIFSYDWPPSFESTPVADQPGLYQIEVPKGQSYRSFLLNREVGETVLFRGEPSKNSEIKSATEPGDPWAPGHQIRLNLEDRDSLDATIEARGMRVVKGGTIKLHVKSETGERVDVSSILFEIEYVDVEKFRALGTDGRGFTIVSYGGDPPGRTIEGVVPGLPLSIKLSGEGYQPAETTVEVKAGETKPVEMELKPRKPEVSTADQGTARPSNLGLTYNIPDGPPDAEFEARLVGSERSQDAHKVMVRNGSRLLIRDLPPGRYYAARVRSVPFGGFSRIYKLDAREIDVAANETAEFQVERENARRIRGRILEFQEKTAGYPRPVGIAGEQNATYACVIVCNANQTDESRAKRFDVASCTEDGSFITEPLVPGDYRLRAEIYKPLTKEQMRMSGAISPSWIGETIATVPAEGEPRQVEILPGADRFPEAVVDTPAHLEEIQQDLSQKLQDSEDLTIQLDRLEKMLIQQSDESQRATYRRALANIRAERFHASWGEAHSGIQAGISRVGGKPQVKSGERLPLEFYLRNTGDKSVKVQVAFYFHENVPAVTDKNGQPVKVESILLSGSEALYTESLRPGEIAAFRHMGLGIGENPKPGEQSWHPFIAAPEPGTYRLTQSAKVSVTPVDEEEAQPTGVEVTSGAIDFEIAAAANAAVEAKSDDAIQVEITARDVTTGNPIPKLRVVPASNDGDRKHVTWQSQYLKDYTAVPAEFRMERGWDKTLLRIEAEGYRPVVTDPIARNQRVKLDLPMTPDLGLTGTVLTPEGKPAEGASVAVCTWTNEVTVENGGLRYGHHAEKLRPMAVTHPNGAFVTPAEVDEYVLVIAHESGYAEATAAELAKSLTIQLKPWGRVEGEYAVAGNPQAGQQIHIAAGRGDAEVILHYSAEVTTDTNGKFVAGRIPPVQLYVSPIFQSGDSKFHLTWFSGSIRVKSKETTHVSLPVPGKPLIGRVVLPEDSPSGLEDLKLTGSIVLRPPRIGFGSDESEHAAYAKFMQSDVGKAFQRSDIPVNADGTFRIEGLPETTYVLHVEARPRDNADAKSPAVGTAVTRVTLPPATPDAEPFDLGELKLTLRKQD